MNVADIDQELDRARRAGAVRDIAIPPCPELLVALQKEVSQPDPEPAQIAHIASSDVAMAAALLRAANSPLYARAEPVSTVRMAIAVLGLRPSTHLLTGFLARHAIRINSPLLEHFWESSTRRALALAYIARQLYGLDADLAHTFGLFCHVGLPIMMQGLRGYSGTLAEALARQDRSFTETENAVHRTDHAVVGAIVAKTWRLPPVISIAVRLHHDFSALNDDQIPASVRTLVAAGLVAERLVGHFEEVPDSREWQRYGAQCLTHLQVHDQELLLWGDALQPVFEAVAQL